MEGNKRRSIDFFQKELLVKMNHREASSYIKNHILRSIKNDVWPLVKKKDVYFAIPREVYAYLDFLGQLSEGKQKGTFGIISFLKRYFKSPASPFYAKLAHVLTIILRHGCIHQISPKILKINDIEVAAIIGRGREIDSFKFSRKVFTHLQPIDTDILGVGFWSKEEKQWRTGRIRALWIPVSVKTLYRDLKNAVLEYEKAVRSSDGLLRNLEKGLTLITTPITEDKMLSKDRVDPQEIDCLKNFIR